MHRPGQHAALLPVRLRAGHLDGHAERRRRRGADHQRVRRLHGEQSEQAAHVADPGRIDPADQCEQSAVPGSQDRHPGSRVHLRDGDLPGRHGLQQLLRQGDRRRVEGSHALKTRACDPQVGKGGLRGRPSRFIAALSAPVILPSRGASMERKQASDFDPEVLNLFDQYVHGLIDRRGFLERAARFAVGGVTAAMLLDALNPRFAEAQQIAKDDRRLATSRVEYDSPKGTGKVRGYLALPAKRSGRLPGVLVVHENRGLNPHIEDVARRIALEQYVAFAPDALTPLGGYPGDEDKARELFAKLDQDKTREDFVAAVAWLKARPECTGKVGVVGFCWGGGITNMLATRIPDLSAAVPFYGPQPPAEDVEKIKAPLLIHYAENDERIDAGIPAFEAALKANHVRYEMFTYPGTQHGFNNDTTPRYDKAAATLAWQRTTDFFKKNLRGEG